MLICRGWALVHRELRTEYKRLAILHHHRGEVRVARVSACPSGPYQGFASIGGRADGSGKHVVFGEVVSGMEVVKASEKVGSKDGKVSSDKRVVVIKCGTV